MNCHNLSFWWVAAIRTCDYWIRRNCQGSLILLINTAVSRKILWPMKYWWWSYLYHNLFMLNGLLPTGTCFKICMFWYHLTLPRSSSTRENEKRLAKMEVFSLKKMLLWLITVVNILGSTAECREPVLHRVGGGKYTWAPNMNFTAWAMHEEFHVGDWLCKWFPWVSIFFRVLNVLQCFIITWISAFWRLWIRQNPLQCSGGEQD